MIIDNTELYASAERPVGERGAGSAEVYRTSHGGPPVSRRRATVNRVTSSRDAGLVAMTAVVPGSPTTPFGRIGDRP